MVKIYTKEFCPYCRNAKALLDSLNIPYEEIDTDEHPEELEKAKEKSGMQTVPQIFAGEKVLGGFDDINKLNQEGKLEDICKGS